MSNIWKSAPFWGHLPLNTDGSHVRLKSTVLPLSQTFHQHFKVKPRKQSSYQRAMSLLSNCNDLLLRNEKRPSSFQHRCTNINVVRYIWPDAFPDCTTEGATSVGGSATRDWHARESEWLVNGWTRDVWEYSTSSDGQSQIILSVKSQILYTDGFKSLPEISDPNFHKST